MEMGNFLNFFLFFKKLFICLFIYLFLAALGLHCCVRAFSSWRQAGAALCCGARASHCSGARASVVVARGPSSCGLRALERRLSSCGAGA